MMSAIFIKISCSLDRDIINFCTAAPAISKPAFFKLAMIFFSAANGKSVLAAMNAGTRPDPGSLSLRIAQHIR